MSLLLRPEIEPTDASMLTLVAAMAVTDGIRKVTGLETGIKWPNDVVIDGKKVCGILTEMSTEFERINYVVPGIGINVNQEEYPEAVSYTHLSWTRQGEAGLRSAHNAESQRTPRSKFIKNFDRMCPVPVSPCLVQFSGSHRVSRSDQPPGPFLCPRLLRISNLQIFISSRYFSACGSRFLTILFLSSENRNGISG